MHKLAHYYNNLAVTGITSTRSRPNKAQSHFSRISAICLAIIIGFAPALSADANQRDRMKRIHDRLTGTAPTPAMLNAMISASNTSDDINAALIAIDDPNNVNSPKNPSFYNVTLKNFAAPWTNEEQDIFVPLNDYIATVIGLIRDEDDYRKILYDNVIYTSSNTSVAPYSNTNNQHYIDLESNNIDLSDNANLTRHTQTEITGLTPEATAGIMTTRAASRAFYIDGTNRAMFRFTVLNHLCNDMEQLKDNTRTADRIRQDVARSPGGDSRLFFTNCLGCHAGMDPLVQAYANYQWAYTNDNPDAGSLQYTPGQIQPKYHINANNFNGGYFTRDSGWTNYWRNGPNTWIGWGEHPSAAYNDLVTVNNTTGLSSGVGAKSLGAELAHTDAFARCQVKKIFRTVCLRNPDSGDENTQNGWNFSSMVSAFKSNYNMKQAFARAAVYCSGN